MAAANLISPSGNVSIGDKYPMAPINSVVKNIKDLEKVSILAGVSPTVFLRDWRSAFIVVINIPLSLLGAVLALWLTHQTVNIMTLGGLALAVGILVDEATVAIENIHTHLARGQPLSLAALDATTETAIPRLLAMLCILAVFTPAFFMVGAAKSLFVPLSLAVGFWVITSFLLSGSLLPI